MQQRIKVLLTVVETERSFSQIKMKELSRHTAIHIQPVFGIAPEAFDAVDMVAAFGSPLVFGHNHMVATHLQTRISRILVSVVKTTLRGVCFDQRQERRFLAVVNSKHAHHAVALENAKDKCLAGCAPTALALAMPAKAAFISLDGAVQRFLTAFQNRNRLANQQEKTLGRFGRCRAAKTQPVSWHAKDKTFQQLTLARLAQTTTLPHAAKALTKTAATAFVTAIAQMIKPVITTTFTELSHTHLTRV